MAYVILCNEDDSLYGSHKERIMQRQKLVNNLIFIVDPIYKGIDMTDATVVLEYVLPVSREYKTVNLVLSEDRYNDCYLQYKLPFDVDLTSQAGEIELQLTFVYVEMTPDGIGIQRVRKTSSTTINIVPITAWSDIIPDNALSALDQRLIKMDATMRAMNDYLDVIDSNKVNDLMYDDVNDTLKLSSNGIGIGKGVLVRDMLDDGIPVIDLDSNHNGDSDTNHNNGCGCGCEDNVVEFGYSSGNFGETETPMDDDNVVEF